MSESHTSVQTAPVQLTDREADQVAGGLFYLSAGCSTCRSGLDLTAMGLLNQIVQPVVQPIALGQLARPGF